MGKKIRKISDIWNAIDNQRTVAKTEWRQSYIGVKAALQFIGLILITTQEDFESLEIPIENDGIRHFSHRKVIVSRNGKLSNSSRIQDLMSGSTKVYTDLEIIKIRDNTSNILKLLEPKGVATANNIESRTVDELDILIGVESIIYRVHLVEYRLADIAYSLKGKDRDIFLADQVKTSTAKEDGQLNFTSNRSTLTIGIMIKILKVGMSLTCIGKTQNNEIDVVWLFYGERAISMLSTFKLTQTFVPMLRLVRKTNNKFTLAYNDPEFRFDVKNDNERLLARKVEIVTIGRKHSLTFLNEDNSQIPSESHRIEQQSMNMTRSVCNAINIKVERHHKDACGPVDFIVNEITRVQDKVANKIFNVRSKYRLPYNPD